MKRSLSIFTLIITIAAILLYFAIQDKTTTNTITNMESDTVNVHFIDVGQGASQLIIGPTGKTILIDAGNNSEEEKMVAYIKKQNIYKIDILVGTHPDADHIGGLDAVINNFDIGKIYMPRVASNTKTYEDVLTAIKMKNLKVTTAKAGLTLDWETDASVQMIAPLSTYEDTNEMSAVIKLTYGHTSFLLMGDAEAKSEADILKSGVNVKADVLLIGHHGSNSSTSPKFLNAVDPSYAVIQVGHNNYGHPTSDTLKRLSDKQIDIYRNDTQGNIIFTTDGEQFSVSQNKGISDVKENHSLTKPSAKPSDKPNEDAVTYASCCAVIEAGKAPLHKGDPGYSLKLDRDGDGVACEK